MKGRWMYQLLAEDDCSLGRAAKVELGRGVIFTRFQSWNHLGLALIWPTVSNLKDAGLFWE